MPEAVTWAHTTCMDIYLPEPHFCDGPILVVLMILRPTPATAIMGLKEQDLLLTSPGVYTAHPRPHGSHR